MGLTPTVSPILLRSSRAERMLSADPVTRPYPGLRPFAAHESLIFFGREVHTNRLLEILQREHLLTIIGASGSGKSSLVRAGLLPALAAGWLGTGSDWRMAVMRPGGRPMRNLAHALLSHEAFGRELYRVESEAQAVSSTAAALPPDSLEFAVGRVEAELRRGPLGLIHLTEDVRRIGRKSDPFNVLVLVDQFEELFTYASTNSDGADDSEAFVELLLSSRSHREARIYVAVTMRTDFLGNCVRFLNLPEAINRTQYLTPRLNRAELAQAIVGPARVFGGDVEPTLVEELVNSVSGEEDELPVLQHVLGRMWELAPTTDEGARDVTWELYGDVGGASQALSRHADTIFAALSGREQALTEGLFRCITEGRNGQFGGQGVRRPQTLDQIADAIGGSWPEFVPVVGRFASEGVHFLSPMELQPTPATIVDLSHEALIRQWSRLRAWATDEAERANEYQRWRRRALDHASGGELLTGADLARAIDWREGNNYLRDGPLRWRPNAPWARRYASGTHEAQESDVDAEFQRVLGFISSSENAERRRVEAARAAAERERQLERERLEALKRAAEAEARVERERADAAARQTAEAERHAKHSLELARLAEDRATEALARQIATEALQYLGEDPERGQLLAVLAYRTAQLPATEVVLRQAFVRGQALRRVLRGHAGRVQRSSFSPDGRRVVSASWDATAKVWDTDTGELAISLAGDAGPVLTAAVSADGRRILTGGHDSSARLWDARTGQLQTLLRGHSSALLDAAFSADGTIALTASKDATARIWDTETGDLVRTLAIEERPQHKASVVCGEFSANGTRILTASFDGTARLWDPRSGKLTAILRGHEAAISRAALSHDGSQVVTASEDHTARIYDARTGKHLATLLGHGGPLTDAAFSADKTRVVTGSRDGTARLWDPTTGKELAVLRGHGEAVLSVVFSDDGTKLATASEDETARIWDPATGELLNVLAGHTEAVSHVAFSPGSETIVTTSWDSTARLWDASSARLLTKLDGHAGEVTCAAFSPYGGSVVTGGDDGSLRVWDTVSGRLINQLAGHGKRVSRALFSPKGHFILSASHDGTACLWARQTGEAVAKLVGHSHAVLDAAFSPDGTLVLTTSQDNSARLWTETGEALVVLGGTKHVRPAGSFVASAFSQDGSKIVTAGSDGRAYLWDALTGELSAELAGHRDSVLHAQFSPDGTAVLTASDDGTARIWRTRDGEALCLLQGHRSSVMWASFSRSGSAVVTASRDQTARLWEPSTDETGRAIAPDAAASELWGEGASTSAVLYGHGDAVVCAAFSPDGATVVTTSADTTMRAWDSATGRPLSVQFGHSQAVLHAAFSPDGRTVATFQRRRHCPALGCSCWQTGGDSIGSRGQASPGPVQRKRETASDRQSGHGKTVGRVWPRAQCRSARARGSCPPRRIQPG